MGFIGKFFRKKRAGNRAYGLLRDTYSPVMQQGVGATNFLGQMLGIGGTMENGYQGYLDRAGYKPALQEMQRGVTGNQAAAGMLNSGSTSRRLLTEGAKINHQFHNNYLAQLAGLAGIGMQGGQLISGAGNRGPGESTASSWGRAIQTGAQIAGLFSDARLKTDVELVERLPDGLGIYEYRYKGDDRMQFGVVAHEVAELRPHALGPVFMGYATVDYGAL